MDKWYMGFELISLPERVLARKGLDCDDFAALSNSFFGELVYNDGSKYFWKGMFCIWSNDFKFLHWVAIWENRVNNGQPKYFRVSNNESDFVGEICEGFGIEENHKGLFVLGHITITSQGKLKFKAVYGSENEVN